MQRLNFALIMGLCAPVAMAQSTPAVQNGQQPQDKIPVVKQQVTVTALRSPLPLDASASSVRVLTGQELQQAPGFALDDSLKQVAGFQLFRRTSSWVANPTSSGVSLRGLGSTAASRTLILSDQVPLNDAFGGWVHWNEIPRLAMRSVELMRGGASDLYGSSAIGGAINVLPIEAGPLRYAAQIEGGTMNTAIEDGLLTAEHKGWSGLGAATIFHTDGYKITAPSLRGTADVPSNVESQSGRLEARRQLTPELVTFLRGNVLNESRSNGTLLQTNAARLWRYQGGGDWVSQHDMGRAFLRLYGSREHYRQSFGSVAADRNSEKLTRLQVVPSNELGAATQYAKSMKHDVTLAIGADTHDVRATDYETPVVNNVKSAIQNTTARERDTGVYGEGVWQPRAWVISLSARGDWFQIFDARAIPTPAKPLPTTSETVFSPRLGVVRQLGHGVSLTGSVFRAFRGPTLNELYRQSQVGAETTLANPALRSERATGFEGGGLMEFGRAASLRATGFWTEVNRPITTVIQTQTATTVTDMRQNAGQLRSRGMMLEGTVKPVRYLTFTGAYQFAVATVTAFAAQPYLVGKWAPEVPRQSLSLQATVAYPKWGRLNVYSQTSGRQYDDSANTEILHGYTRFDVQAERDLGHRFTASVAVQNLLDRSIDASRNPLVTLATPQTVTLKLNFHGALR